MNCGNRSFSGEQSYFDVVTMSANQTLSTIADITGMVMSKTLEAGIYYKWTVSLYVVKTTTSTMRVSIADEANNIVVERHQTMVNGYGYAYTFCYAEVGKGIQVTRKLRGYCDSGSAIIYAQTLLSQFMFERMT